MSFETNTAVEDLCGALREGVASEDITRQQAIAVIDEFIKKFQQLGAQVGAAIACHQSTEDGADAALRAYLLENKTVAEACLDHPSGDVRLKALDVLKHHCDNKERLKEHYRRFSFHDTDPHVQAAALGYLAAAYSGTCDEEVGMALARIVCNSAESRDIRLCAYLALWELVGRPVHELPNLREFRLPEDIDQGIVGRFLQGK